MFVSTSNARRLREGSDRQQTLSDRCPGRRCNCRRIRTDQPYVLRDTLRATRRQRDRTAGCTRGPLPLPNDLRCRSVRARATLGKRFMNGPKITERRRAGLRLLETPSETEDAVRRRRDSAYGEKQPPGLVPVEDKENRCAPAHERSDTVRGSSEARGRAFPGRLIRGILHRQSHPSGKDNRPRLGSLLFSRPRPRTAFAVISLL